MCGWARSRRLPASGSAKASPGQVAPFAPFDRFDKLTASELTASRLRRTGRRWFLAGEALQLIQLAFEQSPRLSPAHEQRVGHGISTEGAVATRSKEEHAEEPIQKNFAEGESFLGGSDWGQP